MALHYCVRDGYGHLVDSGTVQDEHKPGLADLVNTVGTRQVVIHQEGGGKVEWTRSPGPDDPDHVLVTWADDGERLRVLVDTDDGLLADFALDMGRAGVLAGKLADKIKGAAGADPF